METLWVVVMVDEVKSVVYSKTLRLPFTPQPGMHLQFSPVLSLHIEDPTYVVDEDYWLGEVSAVLTPQEAVGGIAGIEQRLRDAGFVLDTKYLGVDDETLDS